MGVNQHRRLAIILTTAIAVLPAATAAFAQDPSPGQSETRPWMNTSLSPDDRADLVLKELTLDEKIALMHGNGQPGSGRQMPTTLLGNGGAGYVFGIPRLGIPSIQMSDAAYGVRSSAENGRYSTALPSDLALAATWDTQAACDYGALIGRELRAQGYNMSLAGGVNLAREPRNGRTFEYQGEDPILAGTIVGNRIKCERAQHVIADIKHFALNDQESGRQEVNVVIGKRAMRESDLLAFQIGIDIGKPGAGFHMDAASLDPKAIADFAGQAKAQGVTEFLMHIIPNTITDAFAQGEILQILLIAMLFAARDLAVLGEQQAQIYEGFDVFRIAINRLLVERCRLLILALTAIKDAEIVLRLRIMRIAGDGFLEFPFGFGRAIRLQRQHTQLIVSHGEVRVELDRFF